MLEPVLKILYNIYFKSHFFTYDYATEVKREKKSDCFIQRRTEMCAYNFVDFYIFMHVKKNLGCR